MVDETPLASPIQKFKLDIAWRRRPLEVKHCSVCVGDLAPAGSRIHHSLDELVVVTTNQDVAVTLRIISSINHLPSDLCILLLNFLLLPMDFKHLPFVSILRLGRLNISLFTCRCILSVVPVKRAQLLISILRIMECLLLMLWICLSFRFALLSTILFNSFCERVFHSRAEFTLHYSPTFNSAWCLSSGWKLWNCLAYGFPNEKILRHLTDIFLFSFGWLFIAP